GISPGYDLDDYDFPALAAVSDFAVLFGFDWNDPACGPIRNTGTLVISGGSVIENSVRGAVDHVLGNGYPAGKLLVALPFYSSTPGDSWYQIRDAWAQAGPLQPDPTYLETFLGGRWWTTPAAIAA